MKAKLGTVLTNKTLHDMIFPWTLTDSSREFTIKPNLSRQKQLNNEKLKASGFKFKTLNTAKT